jgi:RND superfamily putative drug exporter
VVAAGFVLAASFGVLVISPSLAQLGFAVALGILLSSMVTARVLIPALAVIGDRRAWWPSRLQLQPVARRGPASWTRRTTRPSLTNGPSSPPSCSS